MDRRKMLRAVAALLGIAPLVVRAQRATAVHRIGILSLDAPMNDSDLQLQTEPLHAFGWVVGRNLIIERRYAYGRTEMLRPLAEELVRLKVEIIATMGTAATLAARDATSTIPIVIYGAGDPVRSGLVQSLARPGGNITGYAMLGPELDAKRLAVLRELIPDLRRVGRLENSNNPYFGATRKEFEQACGSSGIQPIIVEVATADDLENAVAEMAHRRAQALLLSNDEFFYENRVPLMRAVLTYALPTIAYRREVLEAGALISYTSSDAEQAQRFAAFVDRILRGAKPADLPIEQASKFELAVNLTVARAIGVTIPTSMLLRADDVIQ